MWSGTVIWGRHFNATYILAEGIADTRTGSSEMRHEDPLS